MLYDKSDFIKETFITALNKKILIYRSINYFDKKTENEIFKIISPEKFLKFYVEKDATRNPLGFQLTNASGELPKLKDKKVYNLSLTRIGEKRNRKMAEPIEAVIVRAQKSFEIAGGPNLVQIEIEDNWVLNIFRKYKNVRYRLTPLGLLFPPSIKNDTGQMFITSRGLNYVRKSLINSKSYGLLGIIDLKKINNWEGIKGQSLSINATLEEQKEINNSRHLCFPFLTSTPNDLLNFNVNLIDDHNKQITFVENEKKVSILNFKIDVFLKRTES